MRERLLLFLLHPDGQFIHQRDMLPDAPHDDCAAQRQQKRCRIHGEGERGGQYVSCPMKDGEQIGDRHRVGEIDEVGVLSEDLKRTPRHSLCPQPCEERKECERCADGVEDAKR